MAASASGYDAVLSSILTGESPSVESIAGRLTAALSSLVKLLPGLLADAPDPAVAFLVPDSGPAPGPGQLTESAFVSRFVHGVSTRTSAGGTSDEDRSSAMVTKMLTTARPLGTVEGLVRFMLDLPVSGSYDAGTVADQLAAQVGDRIDGWHADFTDPIDPTIWGSVDDEAAQPQAPAPQAPAPRAQVQAGAAAQMRATARSGAPEALAALATTSVVTQFDDLVTAASGPFPKAGLPSTSTLGQRVHRHVQKDYANNFNGHFVAVEGSAKMDAAGQTTSIDGLVGTGALDPDHDAKAWALRHTLKNVEPIQPDIADLEDVQPGLTLSEWGWFEIKPIRQVLEGMEQLAADYLIPYEKTLLSIRPTWLRTPNKLAFPGLWWPREAVMFDSVTGRIVLITRLLPGVIIYYNFDGSSLVGALFAAIGLSLGAQAIKKLLTRVRTAAPGGSLPDAVPALLAVVLVVAIVFLVVVSLPEDVVAGLIAACAAVVTWLGTLVESMGSGALPVLGGA